jgi:hypothetical protein
MLVVDGAVVACLFGALKGLHCVGGIEIDVVNEEVA